MSSQNCMNPRCDYRERVDFNDKAELEAPLKLMQCSGCKKTVYCGKDCQRTHWPEHKKICKKLREADNVPAVDELHARYEEMRIALYGNHAPASEQIRWNSIHATDAKSRKVKAYMDKLDIEHVGQYAIEKYINNGRGAVVFNMNYPPPLAEGSGRFLWSPLAAIAGIGDETMLDIVAKYNPEGAFVIFYVLPSEDGLSADVWSTELFCTPPPFVMPEIRRAMKVWEPTGPKSKKPKRR